MGRSFKHRAGCRGETCSCLFDPECNPDAVAMRVVRVDEYEHLNAALESAHAILADSIARGSWTMGAAINAESILRHALKRTGSRVADG